MSRPPANPLTYDASSGYGSCVQSGQQSSQADRLRPRASKAPARKVRGTGVERHPVTKWALGRKLAPLFKCSDPFQTPRKRPSAEHLVSAWHRAKAPRFDFVWERTRLGGRAGRADAQGGTQSATTWGQLRRGQASPMLWASQIPITKIIERATSTAEQRGCAQRPVSLFCQGRRLTAARDPRRCAPSKARRFLWCESHHVVKPSQHRLPSVAPKFAKP